MSATHAHPLRFTPPLSQLVRVARLTQPLVPRGLQRRALTAGLNRAFASALRRGELDFLCGRWARITVPDITLDFALTVQQQRLQVALSPTVPDVTFRGDTASLLAITAGKVDPDTLFFRRKLAIEGDTELGLALKNFLDSQDPEQLMPPRLYRLMVHLAS